MIDGPALRDARNRAGMTQSELAQALEVSQRTVGNWERGESVPRNKLPQIRTLLGEYLGIDDSTPTLRQASDTELLGELARRLGRAGRVDAGSVIPIDRQQRMVDAAQPVEQAAGTTSPRKPDPDPASQDDGSMEPS